MLNKEELDIVYFKGWMQVFIVWLWIDIIMLAEENVVYFNM